MKKITVALGVLMVLIAVQGVLAAPVEQKIPFSYQTTLGPQSTQKFTFALYDAAVGGRKVWQESRRLTVDANGMISHTLGSVIPFRNGVGGPVDFSQQLYVQVWAQGSPLKPRVRLNAVPYALHSVGSGVNSVTTASIVDAAVTGEKIAGGAVTGDKIASGAVTDDKISPGIARDSEVMSLVLVGDGSGSSLDADLLDGQHGAHFAGLVEQLRAQLASLVPPGTVVAFAGTALPTGWLWCDGSSKLITEYPALFNAIGTAHGSVDTAHLFNLPDYRGRFLRGVDGTAGVDPDKTTRTPMKPGGNDKNNVGSVQSSTYGSHDHPVSDTHDHPVEANLTACIPSCGNTGSGGMTQPKFWDAQPQTTTALIDILGSNGSISVGGRGGSETRPTNAYVNYIIKY